MFQFPRIGARMTQRQRVNYAWWQTSRNRVASPGKTAAVGDAAEQGKITPGTVELWGWTNLSKCHTEAFFNSTKAIGFFIVSKFAYVTFEKRNSTNRMPTTNYLRCLLPVYNQNSYIFQENCCIKKLSFGSNASFKQG